MKLAEMSNVQTVGDAVEAYLAKISTSESASEAALLVELADSFSIAHELFNRLPLHWKLSFSALSEELVLASGPSRVLAIEDGAVSDAEEVICFCPNIRAASADAPSQGRRSTSGDRSAACLQHRTTLPCHDVPTSWMSAPPGPFA